MEGDSFTPEKVFWLISKPHPHWVETTRDNLKLDFKETGFRQFISLSSNHIVTDAMLMFGLQYAYETQRLIESLNPVRLMVRMKPGSYLGMSHHFLGAPFEIEMDDVLREFLNNAREILESTGFGRDVVVISFNPYIEDMLLENLNRIRNLNYKFMSST
ncbi:hypothetical protein BCF55_1134 [Hydrogenivirga caldilitoris]|uniref:Uncharacterized protein n=2 Tax=Hydrogenivirga caldilitoris TaxID=246264 RepID=A0A497XRR5_9AQUI|nr:hypothetical protein BCF55_1134 [Hydrogenivirga caldilitoris]